MNNFTDRINLLVKFIHRYIDNNLLIYTDKIINNISIKFKKTNRTVI